MTALFCRSGHTRRLFLFLLTLLTILSKSDATKSQLRHRQIQTTPQQQLEKIPYPMLANYQAKTHVETDAAIDLDILEMKTQFGFNDSSGFSVGMSLYEKGGHSHPMAIVNITTPLESSILKGESFTGINVAQNHQVTIFAAENYPVGSTILKFKYDTRRNSTQYVCQVGGKPAPYLDYCLAESGELISISSGRLIIEYEYNLYTDNTNDETIQQFSTEARNEMYLCDNCPYVDYKKFYNYYGRYDYVDHLILSAQQQRQTQYQNGNIDFTTVGLEGRGAVVWSASIYMSIFMKIIRQLERGIDDCQLGVEVDPSMGKRTWDSAVALYTGSLEGQHGSIDDGLLLYNLANKRCVDFKTCGLLGDDAVTGRSYVNVQIIQEFRDGQRLLEQRNCEDARNNKKRIVQYMLIPLIQSLLKNAWLQSYDNDTSESTIAKGATLAASITPFIHACGKSGVKDAKIIHDNMDIVRSSPPDFHKIRTALEQNYNCLNITCSNVGGYWNLIAKQYKQDFEPCTSTRSDDYSMGADNNVLAINIAFVGATILAIIVAFVSWYTDRDGSAARVDKQPFRNPKI